MTRASDKEFLGPVRTCAPEETGAILTIIAAASIAYRGKIPDDCWHEPYMQLEELRAEMAAGVSFLGCNVGQQLAGVMGIQRSGNVELIRHAYVLPAYQGRGVGAVLLGSIRARAERQLLVGTWAAATWAIAFYEKHGFQLVPDSAKASLLKAYWTVSDRQIATSVVLAQPKLTQEVTALLIARSRS